VSGTVKSVEDKGQTDKLSSNVKNYLIGVTVCVFLIAIIAIIAAVATPAGCELEWQKSDGGTCVPRCSDGLSTWDGSKCVKCAETQFSKENKCTEQCEGNTVEPYWDPSKKKCVACRFPWEDIRGKTCFEKCEGHNYNERTGKCDGCVDYWLKKENG